MAQHAKSTGEEIEKTAEADEEKTLFNFDIKLISREGEAFSIIAKAALISPMIKTMVTNAIDDDEEEQEIPLPNISTSSLAKVVQFMNHYFVEPMKPIEKPLKDPNLHNLMQAFYADFIIEMKNPELFDVILAANYLDCGPLLELGSARVASLIKNQTVEQIRINLDIVNDFTPEEESKARQDHGWVDEL